MNKRRPSRSSAAPATPATAAATARSPEAELISPCLSNVTQQDLLQHRWSRVQQSLDGRKLPNHVKSISNGAKNGFKRQRSLIVTQPSISTSIAGKPTDFFVLRKRANIRKTSTTAEGSDFLSNQMRSNGWGQQRISEFNTNSSGKAADRLRGAFFRMLNEEMYSKSSPEMFKQLQSNRSLFSEYHEGYRRQMRGWKTNPTELIIEWLRCSAARTAVIVDLGCGEALIARSLPQLAVKSFDFVASDPEFVIEANILHLPVENESIDIAVFCLSLMGTDWPLFIVEAWRVLKMGGILKIAEVQSRFEDVGRFINGINQIGFQLSRPAENIDSYFYILEFKKLPLSASLRRNKTTTLTNKTASLSKGTVLRHLPSSLLLPCLYKKR